jgi:deoxyribonuclease-4
VKNVDNLLDDFDNTIGLKYLKNISLNDSNNKLGSGIHSHTHLGKGEIGIDAFIEYVNSDRLTDVIMTTVTPIDKLDKSKV